MKYKVTVNRALVQRRELEVEAENSTVAKQQALAQAPDLDFTGTDDEADYEVAEVRDADDEVIELCEECGAEIPGGGSGYFVNKHHKESCSLYDPEQD